LHWLQVGATILYAAGLIACCVLAWALVIGRFGKAQAVQGAMALAPAALLAGLLLASEVVPTSGPLIILAVYLPFFALGAWFLYFSQLVARGRELREAGMRAFLWTIPSLLLSPLALGLLYFLLPPR
jgi:mannose/fructose/N-acetylgalactosamine-specific phosphotransferase system component IIC